MRNGLLTRGILWLGTLLFPALPPLQAAHDLAKQPLTVAADDAFSTLPLLVETQFTLPPADSYQIIVANQNKAQPWHWEIYTTPAGELEVYLPGFQPAVIAAGIPVADGREHAAAMRLTAQGIVLSVDGREVKRLDWQSTPQAAPASVEPLQIGKVEGLGCAGSIRSLRISNPVDQTVVAAWDFDRQPINGGYADLSGNGRNALSGSASVPAGSGADLEQETFQLGFSPEYNTFPLTADMVMQLRYADSFRILCANQSKGSPTHWEVYTNNGFLEAYMPGFSPEVLYTPAKIDDGQWHRTTFILEEDRARLFVDGIQVADQALQRKDPAASPTQEPLYLGRIVEASNAFPGRVDQFRLLRGAVTPDGPANGGLPDSDAAFAAWEFDDSETREFPNRCPDGPAAQRSLVIGELKPAYVPIAAIPDTAPLRQEAADWLQANRLSAELLPELKARDEVWNWWAFQYRYYGRLDYDAERYIGHLLEDPSYLKRISSQVFDPNALIQPDDRGPAGTVLRQTRALLEQLRHDNPDRTERYDALDAKLRQLSAALSAASAEEAAGAGAYFAACALRREAVYSNPLLNETADLLGVSRGLWEGSVRDGFTSDDVGGHFVNQYFGSNAIPGGGLYRIKNWQNGNKPVIENILKDSVVRNGRFQGRKLDFGAFATPDVSWDGKKIAFAWTPNQYHAFNIFSWNTCFHIFTVNADGSELTQLTDGAYNDFDPCFLPNGRLAFVSERRGGYIRCFGDYIRVPNYTLFSMKQDGSDIVPMSYFETAEWNPTINNDGMLVYTRWDYTDRENCIGGRFWIANPDGTNPRAPHGNYPYPWYSWEGNEEDFKQRFPDLPYTGWGSRAGAPLVEMGIRQIPGSDRYIFTASPHHGQNFGSLAILDLNEPDDGNHSQIKRLTPYEPYPETEISARLHYKFGQPWPLSKDFYLANCWENLVVVDRYGNNELLCDLRETEAAPDDRFRLIEPMPLAARPLPPVIPTHTYQGERRSPDAPKATIAVMNVYDTDQPLPENTKVKYLRVTQNVLKTNHAMGIPMIGNEQENTPRIPLGIVPVEEDGSVYFEAPVAKELIFQLLDAEQKAIHSMRSTAFVFPGEQLSCQGCHEPTGTAPNTMEVPLALQRPPSKLVPELTPIEPISFYRQVKPLLEKAGISELQQWTDAANGLDYFALRDYSFWFSGGMATSMIGDYPGIHGGSRTIPGHFGARRAKLSEWLDQPEARAKLTDAERRIVNLWLDSNSLRLGAFFREQEQLEGKLILPILDVDPDNLQGTETSGAPLQKNFWHENHYGPYPVLVSSHTRDAVFMLDKSGQIVWEYQIPHPQDVWMLPNGNILIAAQHAVREITRDKELVWEYKVEAPNEIPSVQPLGDGKTLIGIVGQCRLVEVDRGRELHSIQLSTTVAEPHAQFRMCRKTPEGTYLVPFTAEGALREYDSAGRVIREFPPLPMPVCAVRLPRGNTLVTADGRVVEYDRNTRIVWEIRPKYDTPDLNLAVPAGVQRLPNGNTVVCNWNAQATPEKRAAHIFEITPDKRVVWEVESDQFGQIAQCQILTEDYQPRQDINWR